MSIEPSYAKANPNDLSLDPTQSEEPAAELLEVYTINTPSNVHQQFTYLSPELLMEFVEQELHSTDQKILDEMQSIKKDKALAEQISYMGAEATALAENGGISQGALTGGVTTVSYSGKTYTFQNTPEGKAQADAKYSLLLQEYDATGGKDPSGVLHSAPKMDEGMPPGDVAKAAEAVNALEDLAAKAAGANQKDLAADCQALAQKIRDGHAVSKGEFEALAKKCETAATSLTSSADMTMIRLQQLVQDRSRLITMITNVLKAMDEPKDQAVRNMG